MIALVFVLGLGLLINPYGPDLILLWLKTWTMPLPELIQEHGRLNFASSPGWAVLGLGAIYIIVLVGVLPQRPKITWLLPMVFFVLAVQRVRNAPLFAITTALALPDILSHSRLTQWLRHRQWFSSPVVATSFSPGVRAGRIFDIFIKIIAPLAVVAFVLIIQATGISLPVFGRGWARFDSARWPLELLPELETIDHRDLPADRRIFNDLAFGGFLIYHAPNLKIFIDDRCALYGSEFLGQYDLARRAYPRQIDRWQRQYRFCYALVETGGPFDRHLQQSAQWTLIGRSPAATLYQFRLGISKNIH